MSRFELDRSTTSIGYLFNVTGKNIRPRILSAMAGAVNAQREEDRVMREVEEKQDLVNQICEMCLYHFVFVSIYC